MRAFIWLRPAQRLDIEINTRRPETCQMFKSQAAASQETHYVSATKPNRLMLFRETVAVYCENHTEHINTNSFRTSQETHYVSAANAV
jgi:hypothetical protein